MKNQTLSRRFEKEIKIIDQMASQFFHYVRPILFGELPLSSLNPLLKNATITFIDTNSSRFGITNYHVIKEYRKLFEKNRNITCQIDSIKIDVNSRIIDENEKLDLATIFLEENEIKHLQLSPLFHPTWPSKRITNNEPVFILGYPAEFRHVNSCDRIDMHYGSLLMIVNSVSEENFGIEFHRDNWIINHKTNDPSELKRWGGFSGSGVFRIKYQDILPQLVGITFGHQSSYDILLCTQADYILEDGKIKTPII